MKATELAWAAGFFDGEGSVFVNRHARVKGGSTGNFYPVNSVALSLTQVRKEPLERFQRAVGGVGSLGGPYKPKTTNSNPYFKWSTEGRPGVHKVLTKLWSYLSLPKKEQARKCWSELLSLKTKKSPNLPELPAG